MELLKWKSSQELRDERSTGKMRKRLAALLICVLLGACLSACSGGQKEAPENNQDSRKQQEVQNVQSSEVPETTNTPQKTKAAEPAKRDCLDCDSLGDVSCPPCGATGTVQCQKCEGKGAIICEYCDGSGTLYCASCDGTGEGPCAACDGTGVFGDAYTTVRSECGFCGGDGRLACAYCDGSGLKECICGGNTVCDNCHGQGNKDCSTCNGGGRIVCDTCKGSGDYSAVPKDSDSGKASSDSALASEDQEDGIHICSNCQGEGRTGICQNCKGKGYDTKTKQICVECLSTGKNLCEVCEGYGMLDSNGNGVSANTAPAGNDSSGGQHHASGGNNLGQPCPESNCEGGRRKCKVCGGGGQVKRTESAPYYGGYKRGATTTFERCSGCGGEGYTDCLRCGGDGRVYD